MKKSLLILNEVPFSLLSRDIISSISLELRKCTIMGLVEPRLYLPSLCAIGIKRHGSTPKCTFKKSAIRQKQFSSLTSDKPPKMILFRLLHASKSSAYTRVHVVSTSVRDKIECVQYFEPYLVGVNNHLP